MIPYPCGGECVALAPLFAPDLDRTCDRRWDSGRWMRRRGRNGKCWAMSPLAAEIGAKAAEAGEGAFGREWK